MKENENEFLDNDIYTDDDFEDDYNLEDDAEFIKIKQPVKKRAKSENEYYVKRRRFNCRN